MSRSILFLVEVNLNGFILFKLFFFAMKKSVHNPVVLLSLLRPFFHLALLALSFFVAYVIRAYTDLIPTVQLPIPLIYLDEMFLFAVLSSLLFVIVAAWSGLYQLFAPVSGYFSRYLRVFFIWFVLITFLGFYGNGFLFVGGISRFIIIWSAVFCFLFLSIFDSWYGVIKKFFEKKDTFKVLLCYKNIDDATAVLEKISIDRSYSYKTWIFDETESFPTKDFDVFVVVGTFTQHQLQNLFDQVRLMGKSFYHISESFFLDDVIYQNISFAGVMAMEYKATTLDGRAIVIKRISDIFVSGFFLVFFSWLYVLIALFIFIKDGFPLFYVSERIGRGSKPFRMYKFRTMIKNAESMKKDLIDQNERSGPLFKMKDDPRIPARGRFLRKRSLDELPQVWNVFIGTMSLVGPRPHLDQEVAHYQPWQKRLLSIKPGITSYAQIFGRDSLSFDDEARLDLYYIQNRSIFLDVYIVFATIGVISKGN
ncbi:MAG TPA: sugar transferase [Candidatus Absconditabacterales bacterium]|nr:sugar transferase [Candidatus Absconditabacterales bacterium]